MSGADSFQSSVCDMAFRNVIRKFISTPNAPRPVGPYNQAVIVDRTIYASGVLGLDKDTMKLVPGGVVAETKQALINLKNLLEASGSRLENVVKSTVLLKDIADFASINEVYKEFFTKDFPARSCYQVAALPLGAKIEIEVIAITGNIENSKM